MRSGQDRSRIVTSSHQLSSTAQQLRSPSDNHTQLYRYVALGALLTPKTTQLLNFVLFCDPPGEVDIDHEAREVTMSMIFKWYKADFGPPDVMLPWLLQARCLLVDKSCL